MAQQSKIGKGSTTIKTVNGKTSVTYHSTAVVTFDQNLIVLNSGGWFTSSTKNRMNQASNQFDLGFNVFQKDFAWYVGYKGEVMEFRNGMTLKRGTIKP